MKIIQLDCFIVLCFFSMCCGQKKKDNQNNDCSRFNSQAVAYLKDYNGSDSTYLLKSLELFDKAINCDPLNHINYQGKLTVVNMLGRFKESLELIDKLYELSGNRDVQMLISKAIVYERIGVLDSSKLYFGRAFLAYDRILENDPSDSIKVICDRLYLTAIVEGKNRAIEQLQPHLAKHPNDPTLKLYEEMLRDFDRKTILPDN